MNPVETWAPLFTAYFSDEEVVRPNYAVSVFSGGTFCKLCDSWITGSPEDHCTAHAEDLAAWREVRKVEQARERATRLAEVRASKADGIIAVSPDGLTRKQLVSRMRNAKWKLAHPERYKRDAWSNDEYRELEATINEAQKALEEAS